jgi:hypothetical protein
MLGRVQWPCDRQHVSERDPSPRRGPCRTGTPRSLAGDFADGSQTRAPVARTLQRRSHRALLERLVQSCEGKLQLTLDRAMHPHPPCSGIDVRHVAVASHVERVRAVSGSANAARPLGMDPDEPIPDTPAEPDEPETACPTD